MSGLLAFRHLKNKCTQQASSNCLNSFNFSRFAHSLPFATVKADEISGSQPAEVLNLVQGNWTKSSNWNTIPDPLNGEPFIKVSEVDEKGIQTFVESLSQCPKHGLHNPFKSPERYLMLGDVTTKAAHRLSQPEVSDFFAKLIQRVSPKSYQQAFAEVYVTQKFLENFCGDQVRFLARSFAVPGNHLGQQSHGFRWPYGPVTIITPFNFPLEIPLLQLMGALYMGNKPLLKVDSKVCVVMEQMLRLLHECGLPLTDVDFINSDGKTMNKLLLEAKPRMTLCSKLRRLASQGTLEKIEKRYKIRSAAPGTDTATPKEKDVKSNSVQNSRLTNSAETAEDAAKTAAHKIAEAENKSFLAAEAVKESERVSQMAEDADAVLMRLKEIFEQWDGKDDTILTRSHQVIYKV